MTPRAPPTKNSSFCSTEGAGAQPGPGSVAAACGGGRAWWRLRDPLSAPGYRAGAAATGECQAGASLPVGWAGGQGCDGWGAYLCRAQLLVGSKEREVRGLFGLVLEPVGREGCVCAWGRPGNGVLSGRPGTGSGRKGDGDIPGAGTAA